MCETKLTNGSSSPHGYKKFLLYVFCGIPLTLATLSLTLTTWLSLATLHNNSLPIPHQIHFEKLNTEALKNPDENQDEVDVMIRLNNESPYTTIPLSNLNFYLVIIILVGWVGSLSRILACTLFILQVKRNTLTTTQTTTSWSTVTVLSSLTTLILCLDILQTLSHKDVVSQTVGFYFTNNAYGFYELCTVTNIYVWVDLVGSLGSVVGVIVVKVKLN